MNKFICLPLLTILLAVFFTNAVSAQKTAGIYYFTFMVDNQIVTLEESSNKNGGILSGMSTSVDIPKNLVDSMKRITERALTQALKADAQCIYAKTKGGKTFDTNGMEGGMEKMSVEGLPFAQFNKAQEQFKKDLFVQVLVLIEDGKGVRVDLGGKYSKIKPMISMKAKAFDGNKKVVWEHDAELKNLAKLKRWQEENDGIQRKGGAVFSAEMIVEMYRLVVTEFLGG